MVYGSIDITLLHLAARTLDALALCSGAGVALAQPHKPRARAYVPTRAQILRAEVRR
jgi:hypothetical protein